jgi:uncharacterized damage-inducible protein DinB
MTFRALVVLSALLVRPLMAQGDVRATDVRSLWSDASKNIERAAVDVPEEKYSYKPTPDVRAFGELVSHVAGVQGMLCAAALGEKPPSPDVVDKGPKSKEALLKALRESNEHCARAYAQTDAASDATIDFFGMKRTRFYWLMFNAMHDNEHYGNIVTYMRLNGMVPPSSQPAPKK